MKTKTTKQVSALALGLLVSFSAAQARVPGVADARCNSWSDSLDGEQAKVRANWALGVETDPIMQTEIERHIAGTGVAGSTQVSPGYPTYGRFSREQKDWVNDTSPKWFAPPTAGSDGKLPAGYEISFFCASGCYAPDQNVLFLGGYENIVAARQAKLDKIQALDPASTLDSPRLVETDIAKFLTDVKAVEQTLLTFRTRSGGSLKVTENHPLVDSEGNMRLASTLKVGESLVKADGTPDVIVSVNAKKEFTKVYNVDVSAPDVRQHVIVAQGYLNGALYYQNVGVKELNRRLLRRNVTAHLIQS